MRKLASIQEVKEVSAIENADAIELAKVLGWEVVIKKGEYQAGDKVIYCEIDSVFPQEERYSFLANVNYRIRTAQFRGQISQGLCLPLSLLPEKEYAVGDEVTEELGIYKYQPVLPNDGIVESKFPSTVMQTDEVRVQNLESRLEKEQGEWYVKREKLDGTSTSVICEKDDDGKLKVSVGGRNLMYKQAEEGQKETVYWQVAKEYDLAEKLLAYCEKTGRQLALQGETIGVGILKNKYKLKGYDFYAFNIFDIDNYRYLSVEEFNSLTKELEIKTVWESEPFKLEGTVKDLENDSIQRSTLTEQVWQEGYVYVKLHPTPQELSTRKQSFKIINPKFLLKFKND